MNLNRKREIRRIATRLVNARRRSFVVRVCVNGCEGVWDDALELRLARLEAERRLPKFEAA